MSLSEDEQQTVNRCGSPDRETVQPHIAFVRAEEDLNGPAMGIIFQDCFIRERCQSTGIPEGRFSCQKPPPDRKAALQHDQFCSMPLAAVHHVGAAFRRYRVKTAGVKRDH